MGKHDHVRDQKVVCGIEWMSSSEPVFPPVQFW